VPFGAESTPAAVASDVAGAGAAVAFRDLRKDFGRVRAVDNVNLTVESGEFLTVLGPSGSGKTTVLKLLAGFETPSSGRIELDGDDVAWLAPSERNIGMVFQNYALFPHLTVADNVAYGLKMRGWPKAERGGRVEAMLALVRLQGMGDRTTRQLSGGQQQRVALARALAFGPRVLLMDEPLGALDKALRLEMGEEIRRIHRETATTVIYVTHDQEEALALSDRVAIMRHGRVVAHGTPEDLYRRPPSPFVATFFGGCNLLPVIAHDRHGGGTRVRVAGGELRLPREAAAGSGETVAAVHPHDLRLVADSAEVAEGLVVSVRVRETLFMGDGTQMVGDVDGGDRIVARDRSPAARRVRPGDTVALVAAVDDVVLLPAESDP
jgi:putative spermidine/putrescine transport system ATP-binding protein